MKRVAVVYGGWSSEREISISSGTQMARAARQAGYEVIEVDATRQLARQIEAELSEFLERADARTVRDDGKMDEAIRKITRQVAMEEIGKKPEVTVSISRLMAD